MHLHDQIKLHKEISKKIEELESQKKALSIAIMEQMTDKTISLPGYIVRRYNKLSIKLTLEQARALNAIKFEEAIDKEKIKTLYKNGHPINGVNEIHYIHIATVDRSGNYRKDTPDCHDS